MNPKEKFSTTIKGENLNIPLIDLIEGRPAEDSGGSETIDLAGGIIMTTDGSETWIPVFDKDQYVYDVTVDPEHPGTIYCNTFRHGAYRSADYAGTDIHLLKIYLLP